MEDKTSIYEAVIREKVAEIRQICNENNIPFFMVFGTKRNDDGEYQMEVDAILPEMFGLSASDRRFSDFVNVQNGFVTVPPKSDEAYDALGKLPEEYFLEEDDEDLDED